MTESFARISSRRPWVTIGIWFLLVLVALGIIGRWIPTATTTELRLIPRFGEVESVTANQLLEGSPIEPPPAEIVIIQSESLTVDDEKFRRKVEEVTGDLRALGPEIVEGGVNYYEAYANSPTDSLALVSTDHRSAIVALRLTGSIGEALENVEEVIHVVQEADHQDGFRVLIVGDASSRYEQAELSAMDLEQGERIGIPVALLILLVLFGAVVAALIPIGLAIVSILITLAIVAVIGNVFGELVFFVLLWITMIGLAVGIDYCLFVVSRFREELARGAEHARGRHQGRGDCQPYRVLQRYDGGHRTHRRVHRPTHVVLGNGPWGNRGGSRIGDSDANAAPCRSDGARNAC